MMDITTLGLAIDSTKVARARGELGRFVKTGDDAAAAATKVEGATQKMGGAFNSVRNILAGMALGATAFELIKMADAMSLVDARLKLAVGGAQDFTKAQEAIYNISQKSSVGLAETSALFTKLHEPVKRLGGGVRETSAIVEAFASSLKVGGAGAQEAAAATLQFAQAMGSGKLQGDEFRSIAEASPRFMKALADGMNVPIEQLKKLGGEGKLTADIVGNALVKSLATLRVEMEQIPDTVGGAMTRLSNDFKVAINDLNKNSNITLGLAGGIEEARKLIPELKNEVADVFESINSWLDRNRDGFELIRDTVGGVVRELWEGVKTLGSFAGFIIEAGIQLGVFKTVWETVRLLIAGVKDGVEIIGAALAMVGSKIMQFLVSPLVEGGRLAAAIAGVFDKELAASMRATISQIEAFTQAGEKYALDVQQKFMDGRSAVVQLGESMAKSAADSAQLKEALAGGAVASADNAREMGKFARQAQEASGAIVTLKNAHAGLTDEQSKQLSKFRELQGALQVRIAELNAELDGVGKLNEAEKAALKFKQDLVDKYKSFTPEQRKAITGLLDEWDARLKLKDALKEQAEAQSEAHKEQMRLWEASERDVEQIRRAIQQQRDHNNAMRLSQRQMERLEMARLDDAIAAARQAVAIDDLTQSCTAETVAHRETLQALLELKSAREQGIAIGAANEAAEAWYRTSENIYSWLSNALQRAFDDGRGFWSSLWDQIKNAFKTTVLNLVVRTAVDWVGLALGITGAGGTLSGGGSGGGVMVGLNNASTLYRAGAGLYSAATGYSGWVNSAAGWLGAGSTAGAAAGSLAYANMVGAAGGDALGAFIAANGSWGGVAAGTGAAAAGTTASVGAGAAAGAASGGAAAAGGAAGAASGGAASGGAAAGFGPYGWIAAAIILLAAYLDDSGTPHMGGYSLATPDGKLKNLTEQQNGIASPEIQKATDKFSMDVLSLLTGFTKEFGSESGVTGVRSIFESDNNDGSWGLFHIEGRDRRLAGFDALGTLPSNPQEGFQAYVDKAAGSIVDALIQTDLPKWVRDELSSLSDELTFDDLAKALDGIIAMRNAIDAAAGEFASLGGVFASLGAASSDAKFALIGLAGGIEGLSAMSASYIQNFYSEGERAAMIMDQIGTALSAVGLALPETRDGFRSMVDAIDLETEAGRQAFITAMNVQQAFASVVPASEQVQEAVDEQVKTTEKAAAQTQSFAAATESAASRVVDAWKSITDSLIAEVNRLRGVLGQDSPVSSMAELQTKFAIDAARARAGDSEAAKRLVTWSQQINSLTSRTSRTRYEASATRASLASTLESIAVQQGSGTSGLVNEVSRMRADIVAELRRSATDQSRTANTIRRATDGDALRTRTAT